MTTRTSRRVVYTVPVWLLPFVMLFWTVKALVVLVVLIAKWTVKAQIVAAKWLADYHSRRQ